MAWWKNRWVKAALITFIGAAGVMGLIYRDVVSRARESYMKAEQYMEWYRAPDKKKQFFEEKFQLEVRKNPQSRESLAFDRDYALEESSLKYAYQWYKDTYELFSPPESQWVKMARVKAPATLALWKQELQDQKVPFEDTMFE